MRGRFGVKAHTRTEKVASAPGPNRSEPNGPDQVPVAARRSRSRGDAGAACAGWANSTRPTLITTAAVPLVTRSGARRAPIVRTRVARPRSPGRAPTPSPDVRSLPGAGGADLGPPGSRRGAP